MGHLLWKAQYSPITDEETTSDFKISGFLDLTCELALDARCNGWLVGTWRRTFARPTALALTLFQVGEGIGTEAAPYIGDAHPIELRP
jgi:hypothetical protein